MRSIHRLLRADPDYTATRRFFNAKQWAESVLFALAIKVRCSTIAATYPLYPSPQAANRKEHL